MPDFQRYVTLIWSKMFLELGKLLILIISPLQILYIGRYAKVRIDNKHMTEPWLDQALMDSAYRSDHLQRETANEKKQINKEI